MVRKLKILACPLGSVGHIHAVQGLTDELLARGHKVAFVIDVVHRGRLSKNGYEELTVKLPKPERDGYNPDEEFWLQYVRKNGHLFERSPLEQVSGILPIIKKEVYDQIELIQDDYRQIVESYAPDLIIYDGYAAFPALLGSGIPLVWLYSAAVNGLLQLPELPPANSGYPLNSDKEQWKAFEDDASLALQPILKRIEDSLKAVNVEIEPGRLHPFPNFLTIFMQPKELRYDIELPKNCLAADCLVRKDVDTEEWNVPAMLSNMPGKLIYFSMGSFCCAHIPLMKKLLNILAKSPNRFVVSMGPYPEKLPGKNMWGAKYLPQTSILPKVDLVITHGGNNTVTETFFFGIPMLVLPFFGDQHDNAQRILEVGLGDKADPFRCGEEELLQKIENLVNNHELKTRMKLIGERIRSEDDRKLIVDVIESRF